MLKSFSPLSIFLTVALFSHALSAAPIAAPLATNKPTDNFTYSDLQRIFNTANPQSIASLLPLLPDSFKAKVAFVTDSGSLQESTAQFPRVLMYGDGDLVITFNSNPSHAGFEALELTHYDWSQHQFIFEEHVFKQDLKTRETSILSNPSNDAPARVQARAAELNDRHDRQGPNPVLCSQCHESSNHPLLPSYPAGTSFLGGYSGVSEDKSAWFTQLVSSYSSNERLAKVLALPGAESSLRSGDGNREFNRLMNIRNRDRIASVLLKRSQGSPQNLSNLVTALADCDNSGKARLSRVRKAIEGDLKLSMAEQFTTDGAYASYQFDGVDGGLEQILPPLIKQLSEEYPQLSAVILPISVDRHFCRTQYQTQSK